MVISKWKVSAVVTPARLNDVANALAAIGVQFVSTPVVDPVRMLEVTAKANAQPAPVQVVYSRRPRSRSHGSVSESDIGKAILNVVSRRDITEWEVIRNLMAARGYAQGTVGTYINRLINEGSIERIDRGVYRLPAASAASTQPSTAR